MGPLSRHILASLIIRQHTSAYVSIRQHTSSYVHCLYTYSPRSLSVSLFLTPSHKRPPARPHARTRARAHTHTQRIHVPALFLHTLNLDLLKKKCTESDTVRVDSAGKGRKDDAFAGTGALFS